MGRIRRSAQPHSGPERGNAAALAQQRVSLAGRSAPGQNSPLDRSSGEDLVISAWRGWQAERRVVQPGSEHVLSLARPSQDRRQNLDRRQDRTPDRYARTGTPGPVRPGPVRQDRYTRTGTTAYGTAATWPGQVRSGQDRTGQDDHRNFAKLAGSMALQPNNFGRVAWILETCPASCRTNGTNGTPAATRNALSGRATHGHGTPAATRDPFSGRVTYGLGTGDARSRDGRRTVTGHLPRPGTLSRDE